MTKTATIQARIDPKVKSRAQKTLYLTQVTLHNGIPFEIKIPNALTAKTLRKSGKGKDLHMVSNVEDLVHKLES